MADRPPVNTPNIISSSRIQRRIPDQWTGFRLTQAARDELERQEAARRELAAGPLTSAGRTG